MGIPTLWECICKLAGADGEGAVVLREAIEKSAVNEAVATVELRRFEEDGWITRIDYELIELTDLGRTRSGQAHHTADVIRSSSSEPEE